MTVAPQLGEKRLVPGSAQVALSQSMPITGRIGAPGVWMVYLEGYPASKSVNLWRYGSGQPLVMAKVESGRESSDFGRSRRAAVGHVVLRRALLGGPWQ